MKVLSWALRLSVFLVVLTFAIRNTEPVAVTWIFGLNANVPLVVALLVAFLCGLVAAFLILLPSLMKAKRQATQASKALNKVKLSGANSHSTEVKPAIGHQ